MSVVAFDFVKKVSIHVIPSLSLSFFFFVEKRCWVVVLNAQFSFSCKLCVSGRLGCHPTFVNLGGLILFCPFKKFHKNYA